MYGKEIYKTKKECPTQGIYQIDFSIDKKRWCLSLFPVLSLSIDDYGILFNLFEISFLCFYLQVWWLKRT